MTTRIEYNGHMIEAKTRHKSSPAGWTLQVHITNLGSPPAIRRCRGPNMYESKKLAVHHCLEFGRRIVDGKLQPIG